MFFKTKEGLTEWIQRDGKSAMLDNFNTRVYYADYIKCETVDIPKKYFPMQYAMPVAKDFPYFDALWHHMNTLKVKNWHTGISFSVLFKVNKSVLIKSILTLPFILY